MTKLTEQIIHKKEIQLKTKLEDIIILSESIQDLANEINQIYNEINKTKKEENV